MSELIVIAFDDEATGFELRAELVKMQQDYLIEMEDARRLSLLAQAALVGVQRERVAAWISLYRAVGGGWDVNAPGRTAAGRGDVEG